jgi:hypothetical protein
MTSFAEPSKLSAQLGIAREELAMKQYDFTKKEATKLLRMHHAILVGAEEANVKDKAKAKAAEYLLH